MASRTRKAVRTSLISLLWTWLALVLPIPLFLWSVSMSASSALLQQRLQMHVEFIRKAHDLVESTTRIDSLLVLCLTDPERGGVIDLGAMRQNLQVGIDQLLAQRIQHPEDQIVTTENLRRIEQQLSQIVDDIGHFVAETDADRRFARAEDIRGRTLELAGGMFGWVRQAESQVKEFSDRLNTQLRSQAVGVLVASVMALLVVLLMYSYRLSVLAQRRAEFERDRFFEASLDMQFIADFDGRFRHLNRSWQRVLGRPIKELLAAPYIYLVHPEDRAATQAEAQRMQFGADMVSFENRCATISGEYRWMLWTATPDIERRLIYGTVRDITDRKLDQLELKESAARLARSNRELEDFASVASHDLQEPLRKVMTFGERIATRAGDALDEQSRDYLERMRNAAERMKTLIIGLLTLSRVTTRGNPFERVALGTVVREVLGDLEVRIEQSGATVEVGDLPEIEADALQMRQLFQNLIGNALKFHRPEQAPRVRISAEVITPDPLSQAQRVRILVEDDGIGFDEKYIERIFGVFQRLHGRNVYEGTGVGLAVCRKIVERHDGTITASSPHAAGARFEVVLPVRRRSEIGSDISVGGDQTTVTGESPEELP